MLGFDVRAARIVWTTAVLLLLFYAVFLASTTIVVIVFAVFFSYLLFPLIQLGERWRPARLPRPALIAFVFLVVLAVATTVVVLFGSQVETEAIALSQNLPSQISAQNVTDRIPLPSFAEPMRARIMEFVRTQLAAGTDQAMPLARKFGEGLVHAASNLIYVVLIPILSFLLIIEAPRIRRGFLSWLGESNKRLWGGIIKELDVLLAKYVRALLLLASATFIAYSIGFYFLDVPYALLLAGLSALLEFIPFAGPLGAIVVTLVVAMFSGHEHLLWLAAFFGAYRLFQDYVINPYLMSEGVEVSPLLVIVGLLAGDQLAGVVGIFLSVPVMAALKIIVARLLEAKRRKARRERDRRAPVEIVNIVTRPPG